MLVSDCPPELEKPTLDDNTLGRPFLSSVRALHSSSEYALCIALSGLRQILLFTQGDALGWYVAAPSGLKTACSN